MQHELDGLIINDAQPAVGAESTGENVGEEIIRWLGTNNKKLNPKAKLLGLGAGYARPELGLARKLNIPDDRVTLIDKTPQIYYPSDVQKDHPRLKYHGGTGMFAYLSRPKGKYDIVTAFGVESVLQDATRMTTFISMLPGVLNRGGFVCVNPYTGENLSEVWKESGFQRVYDSQDYLDKIIYRFNPNR